MALQTSGLRMEIVRTVFVSEHKGTAQAVGGVAWGREAGLTLRRVILQDAAKNSSCLCLDGSLTHHLPAPHWQVAGWHQEVLSIMLT